MYNMVFKIISQLDNIFQIKYNGNFKDINFSEVGPFSFLFENDYLTLDSSQYQKFNELYIIDDELFDLTFELNNDIF